MQSKTDPFGLIENIMEMESISSESNSIISIVDPINVLTSTILTSNIAISFAIQGHKVLLIDLNMIQPSLSLMVMQNWNFDISTNDCYAGTASFEDMLSCSYQKEFKTGGSIQICSSSYDIKKRLLVRNLSNKKLNTSLANLMTFVNSIKNDYRFILVNMPNMYEYNILMHGMLISDFNFLLIDHNKVSLALGFDLVSNMPQIHPLIDFHGILIHRFNFAPNMNDEEKPLIESSFRIPIVALLPEIPAYYQISQLELLKNNYNVQFNKYFKILTQDLYNFINNPITPKSDYYAIEVIIIANNAGIPLFSAYLKDGEIIPENEILASAALTAVIIGVTSALKEISKTNDETKLIKQKNLSLVVEYVPPLRAMLLTGREEHIVRKKLQLFMETFTNKFTDEIKNFVGNISPFYEAL
ncbi:MAG: hypothetical protein ACC656_04065, partial [Candidatus Heimdallarchaeota archaeon]